MVDIKDGIFLTSVDVFFSSKSSATPVQIQIRTVTNGYPTNTIVPLVKSFVPAASVNTSTDVQLQPTLSFQVQYS